jgi:uncharacterized protein (DUF58 family)
LFGKRRRHAGRLKRLSFTRDGKIFFAISIGVGLAAINTGNNLLYLVLGWLLSTIIFSGILSNQALKGLTVRRRPLGTVTANQPFLMEVELRNEKRRLASYTIEVEDSCNQHPVDKRCFFLKLPPGRTLRTSYRHTFARRGKYAFDGVYLSTRFPFGLFRKTRYVKLEEDVVVLPDTLNVSLPASASRPQGEQRSSRVGRIGDFLALREYRKGDDRRSIHWKATARSGRLVVREFEADAQRRFTLYLDNALRRPHRPAEMDAFEDAVRACASFSTAYLAKGYSVQLLCRSASVPMGSGPQHLFRILKTLALLETAEEDTPFAQDPSHGSESLLIVPRGSSARLRPANVSHVVEAA